MGQKNAGKGPFKGFTGGKGFGVPQDKSKLVHGMFLVFGGLMILKLIFGGGSRHGQPYG